MKFFILIFLSLLYLYNLAYCQVDRDNFLFQESIIYTSDDSIYNESGEIYNGEYKEYFPGKVKLKGFYRNGLKHGEFKEYDSLGKLIKVTNWRNGLKHGEQLLYDASNSIKSKEKFSNGIKHGECLYFYWGMLEKVIKYENGNKIDSIIYELGNVPYLPTILLPSELNPIQYKKQFDKNELLSLDSIFLTLVGFPLFNDDADDQVINLNFLKIVSFSFTGTKYEKYCGRSSFWIRSSFSNVIDKKTFEQYFSSCPKSITVFELIVENKDGYQWEIQPRTWNFINNSE